MNKCNGSFHLKKKNPQNQTIHMQFAYFADDLQNTQIASVHSVQILDST